MKSSIALFALLFVGPVQADESDINLKNGPGKKLVAENCAMCHSLDYIPMNSTALDRQGWKKTVAKMIDVMGAPISPDDVDPLVDYLAGHYGK
ncbi:MAG: c-type cytochrome [Gammaproteobacteria bacterium]